MAGRVVVYSNDASILDGISRKLGQDFLTAELVDAPEQLLAKVVSVQPEFVLIVNTLNAAFAIDIAGRLRASPQLLDTPIAVVCDAPDATAYNTALAAGLDDLIDLSAGPTMWHWRIMLLRKERNTLRGQVWRDARYDDGCEPFFSGVTSLTSSLAPVTPGQVSVVAQDGAEERAFLARIYDLYGALDTDQQAIIALADEDVDANRVLAAGASEIVSKNSGSAELGFRSALLERRLALRGRAREQLCAELRLAFVDPLTGLANRRALFRHLSEMLAQHPDVRGPVSVAMLDLDHFKRINDEFGHMVGDQVLCEVAQRLGHNCRRTDVVGRLGGEEFLILMPGATLPEAQGISQRVLRNLSAPLPLQTSNLQDVTITASIGLLAVSDQRTPEEVAGDVDRALMRAKQAGRNNIQLAAA